MWTIDFVHDELATGCKLRDKCLNDTLFSSLADARGTLEEWQEDYNSHRPHSALGNLAPRVFAAKTMMDKLAA